MNTAVGMIDSRLQSDEITVPLGDDSAAQKLLGEMREAADLALRNTDRAHKLVQNFKKISVDQVTTTRETVELPALVQDILELFRINARQANLQIKVNDTLPEAHKNWSGYPGHLTQVLTNLLFNIERYAYPNQSGGKIEIGLSVDDEREPANFVLTVQDFGRGVDPEHKYPSNCFRVFSHWENTRLFMLRYLWLDGCALSPRNSLMKSLTSAC